MTNQLLPKEAIFIRWGQFQLIFSGRAAVLTVAAVGVLMLVGRSLQLW